MNDMVVLVDHEGNEIGVAEKLAAHRDAALHRAISVFLLDAGGSVLLQRRAPEKYHFGGLWTNTCCTHPRQGESPIAAGHRRVREEMGVEVAGELEEVGHFVYSAGDPAGDLTEHEFDHVLVGRAAGDPDPDPGEVESWKWVEIDTLARDLAENPSRYTPWLGPALGLVMES